MHTLISNYTAIISTLTIITFVFLGYIFLYKKQNEKLNWSIFYASFYIFVTLPIVNYICVHFGFWQFTTNEINSIQLPFDIYFLWLVFWGIIPMYFFKGKYLWLIALIVFWLDILIMPELEKMKILVLNKNWLIGEVILIGSVFIPSYFWAYCFYYKKHIGFRALFQIVVMVAVFIIALPFILHTYGMIESLKIHFAPFLFQLLLIITFPSLIAVFDLVAKGNGTPFPYDPTKKLVTTGIYAYCRNPIQWSFTFMFIPLTIYYSSYYLLLGSVISIAYTYGVSDFQEYADMEKRFGNQWCEYKKNVPKWRFLWKPKTISKGTIYFDANCKQCSQISNWFSKSKAINLEIKTSSQFPKENILQATYIDNNGLEYKSVNAIACALEHINLAYATLGWFIRFPIINQFLQIIIDSMQFDKNKNNCENK